MSSGYLTAKQASQKLGVSLSTLYAYVSRGLIRSEPDTIKRRRKYRSEDVEVLLARKSQKATGEEGLAGALNWGEPICDSQLTLIQDGELYYRGQSVSELSRSATFEEVISLLWEGYDTAPSLEASELPLSLHNLKPLERFALALPWYATQDKRALDLRPEAVRRTGARILRALFSTLAPFQETRSLAAHLAEAWGCREVSVLNSALILCADHEFNVSAFTARCVASAGASPYAVVSSGLSALSGFRHGAYTYRVEGLFREAEALGAEEAVQSYLRRGMELPGFGHQLYPEGDPRGRDLLALLEPNSSFLELVGTANTLLGSRPNIDFALVALARTLDLPSGASLAIFSLGRCAGWIAHALEQYETGQLIRPRARYTGRLPQE